MHHPEVKNVEPFKMTGNWVIQSKLLKEKFEQLTDSDLEWTEGGEEGLLSRIQARLHKKREEVINIIKKGQS